MENLTVYIDNGNGYHETYNTSDPLIIYQRLSGALIAKKINCCKWVRSIRRENLYNGYQRITVFVNYGCKEVYTIKE